jgi:hypothetical protein
MPTPSDPDQIEKIIKVASCGDRYAEEYLRYTIELVAVADDLADEDMAFEKRQAHVIRLLEIAYFILPNNAFYMKFAPVLAPLVMNVLITWKKSDELKMTGNRWRQMYGFVWRENVDSIVVAVAAIMKGAAHAESVIDLMMHHHETRAESFEDWVAEGKP